MKRAFFTLILVTLLLLSSCAVGGNSANTTAADTSATADVTSSTDDAASASDNDGAPSIPDGFYSTTMKFNALCEKFTYEATPLDTTFSVTVSLPEYFTNTVSLEDNTMYEFYRDETVRSLSFDMIAKVDKDIVLDKDVAKSDPNAYAPEPSENSGVGGMYMDESFEASEVKTSEKGFDYVVYSKVADDKYTAFVYLRFSDEYILRFSLWDYTEQQDNLQVIIDSLDYSK